VAGSSLKGQEISMSLDLNKLSASSSSRVRRKRVPWVLLLFLVMLAAGAWVWASGYRVPALFSTEPPLRLVSLEVDQGDISAIVTEYGTLESSDNVTVRCKVEALMGQVGGPMGPGGLNKAGGQAGMSGGTNSYSSTSGTGTGTTDTSKTGAASKSKSASKSKVGASKTKMKKAMGLAGQATTGTDSSTTGGSGSSSSSSMSGSSSSSMTGGTGGSGSGGTGGSGSGGAGGSGSGNNAANMSTVTVKPVIRSFTYVVEPHIPLRPQTGPGSQNTTGGGGTTMGGMGGRGGMGGGMGGTGMGGTGMGGARGGQGGRGSQAGQNNQNNQSGPGGMMEQSKPGATTILTILPEGTYVEEGDVVCELDSSAFRDALQEQQIRYLQAKAWVEQAASILEVSKISLEEYRDGIFPQDKQLVRQYIDTCRLEKERADRNVKWSEQAQKKGVRSAAQLRADQLAKTRADLAMNEAEGMLERLEKFTGPRIITELQAKIEAVRTDELAQKAAFQLESDRLKKLETMVENCTMTAPRAGIVAYYHAPFSFRRRAMDDEITEGATVRELQPIFLLPDPNRMQVKARVNETKISMIRTGQRAQVRVEALPGQTFSGTIAEITQIPMQADRRSADVRAYYVTVKIDQGSRGLRPGMSAEVDIHVETQRQVPRVPLATIRWVDGHPYVAVVKSSADGYGSRWEWREIALGLIDQNYAQIVKGLEPGDRVVSDPESLPRPSRSQLLADRPKVETGQAAFASAGLASPSN
jgi:RND family efflux transporter MFP subunit